MSTMPDLAISAAGIAALEALHAENRAAGARMRACYALHQLCVDEQFDRDLASGLIDPDAEPPAPSPGARGRRSASAPRPTPQDSSERPGGGTPDHAVVDPMAVACAELVARYGVHHNRAHSLLTLAVTLVEQFPALLEAMEDGRVDEDTARTLARHMRTVDSRSRHRVQRELVDWLLAAIAAGARPGRDALLSRTDQIIKEFDPDGVLARRAAAVRERNVRVRRRPDGMADLNAHLTAAEATSISAALDSTVAAALAREKAEREESARNYVDGAADSDQSAEADQPASDSRTATAEVNDTGLPGVGPFGPRPDRGERRADALVDAILGTGGGVAGGAGDDGTAEVDDEASLPSAQAVRPQITVFAPLGPDDEPEVYFPRSSAASIDTLIALLSRSVGATITKPLTAPGTADNRRTRRKYRISKKLASRIRLRDGTCRHPGCSVPAQSCDIDHVAPFDLRNPDGGGATEESNLMCLCRRHHRLKTFYTWRYELSRGGTLTITTSSGQTITTHPDGPLARWRDLVGDTHFPHDVSSRCDDLDDTDDDAESTPSPRPRGRPRLNPTVRQTYWYRRACRIAAERQYGIDSRLAEEAAAAARAEAEAAEEAAAAETAAEPEATAESQAAADESSADPTPAFDPDPPPF